nr:unnamed protein product [Digitaria exilis]
MSKGSFLLSMCLLVLLQVCIAAQLPLISSSQPQIADAVLCRDPIRRALWMSSHARDEFHGHSADSISDEELTGDEYDDSNYGAEAGKGLLPPDGDGDGGSSGGTKDSSSGVDVQCPECGKFFKNDKSMFGHLRSHPNRGYKGATPPVKKIKLSPETAIASSSSAQLGTNRLSPPQQHSGRDPQLTPLEKLCACVMLTLKYGRDNNGKAAQQAPPPPTPSPLFGKVEAVGQAEGGTRGLLATGNSSTTDEFKCNNNTGVEAGNLINSDGHSGFIVKIPKKKRNMPKEIIEARSRKKAKLVLTPKEKRPYVCKHCKAEFPTNQALGGHVAGHHREKKMQRLNLNDPLGMVAESHNNGRLQRVIKGRGYDGDEDLSLPRGQQLPLQFPVGLNVPWHSSGMASGGQVRQLQSERRNLGLPSATPARTDHGDARRLLDLNIDLNVEAPELE